MPVCFSCECFVCLLVWLPFINSAPPSDSLIHSPNLLLPFFTTILPSGPETSCCARENLHTCPLSHCTPAISRKAWLSPRGWASNYLQFQSWRNPCWRRPGCLSVRPWGRPATRWWEENYERLWTPRALADDWLVFVNWLNKSSFMPRQFKVTPAIIGLSVVHWMNRALASPLSASGNLLPILRSVGCKERWRQPVEEESGLWLCAGTRFSNWQVVSREGDRCRTQVTEKVKEMERANDDDLQHLAYVHINVHPSMHVNTHTCTFTCGFLDIYIHPRTCINIMKQLCPRGWARKRVHTHTRTIFMSVDDSSMSGRWDQQTGSFLSPHSYPPLPPFNLLITHFPKTFF